MKVFKLIGLFIIVITVSGCNWLFDHDPISFGLNLSFQDAAGKDMVEGIGYIQTNENFETGEVEPELYDLSILINGKNAYHGVTYRPDPLTIHYTKREPYSLLYTGFAERESKITFTVLLACPYIFGDDAEHEITSYLKKKGGTYVHTRLTFDGKDIDITKQEYSNAVATIVLD